MPYKWYLRVYISLFFVGLTSVQQCSIIADVAPGRSLFIFCFSCTGRHTCVDGVLSVDKPSASGFIAGSSKYIIVQKGTLTLLLLRESTCNGSVVSGRGVRIQHWVGNAITCSLLICPVPLLSI